MPPTWRSLSLLQLLRVEEEGAFVGRLGGRGAPHAQTQQQHGGGGQQRQPSTTDEGEDEYTASSSSLLGGAGSDGDGEEWGGGEGASARGGAGGGAGSGAALAAAYERLQPRDRRLVTEVLSGITRWRRRLDFLIGELTGRDPAALDAPLRQLLRMGLYELVELGVPAHVINEHVELAKAVMHQGAASLANGVLRRTAAGAADGGPPLPQPARPPPGAPLPAAADALGVALSHPTWLVARWLRQFGERGTLELLRHNNARPRHSLRLRPGLQPAAVCAQLEREGVAASPSAFLPSEFVRVPEGGMQAVLASGLVRRGDAQVQDDAAGLVVALLDPQPGETVLDACAAPGGKCLFAAARMRGAGRITALDLSGARLRALAKAAARQGYGRMVWTEEGDLRQFAARAVAAAAAAAGGGGRERRGEGVAESRGAEAGGAAAAAVEAAAAATTEAATAEAAAGEAAGQQQQRSGGSQAEQARVEALRSATRRRPALLYDRVLLDAPCSGTGVLAKRADLRWRRSPTDLQQLAALQAELLDAAAALVAPGGLLVYSTCSSIEEEENMRQAEAFLERQGGRFTLEPPPASCGLPPECLSPDGAALAMLPHVHGTDGAFGVRLRRVA
eukprot:scaffold5.g866.t1